MDHDLTTAPEAGDPVAGGPVAGGPEPGTPAFGSPAPGRRVPPRPRSACGEGGGPASGPADAADCGVADGDDGSADSSSGPGSGISTVRLASPGSVVASIPLLFGFHPDNSLVVLGISRSADGGRFIRHGVRIDLDQVRSRERAAALELAARLRDHGAEVAILVAFGPRGATGAQARPDHCRKLMAAFRAQIEAAPSEERVTVVDALYTCNGRWWSYMCRNTRCCPAAGTVVPAEAPLGLSAALTTRGHTVYPSREALDATLAPYPPEVLARTAAAAEPLDPTWYDTDAGLADARRLMDALLLRCGDPGEDTPTADTPGFDDIPDFGNAPGFGNTPGFEGTNPATKTAPTASAARIGRRGLAATVTLDSAVGDRTSNVDSAGGGTASDSPRRRTAAAESARRGTGASAVVRSGATSADSAINTADSGSVSSRRRTAAAESARRSPGASAVVRGGAAGADPVVSAADSGSASSRRRTAAVRDRASSFDSSAMASAQGDSASPRRIAAAEVPRSARRGLAASATVGTGTRRRAPKADSVSAIPAARFSRRVIDRVPASDEGPGFDGSAPLISDAEVAELLIALLNWRVRDYLACAAATEDSAGRLLRLCTELARRAPHPELRLAPYALAAWAAWAIGRPSIAQCAVDRALAIDPEYKFASLIRAGLHHAIDGEGVRESAANTRRDLFGEVTVDSDTPDPESAPVPVPSQRSTETVRTDTDLEVS